MASMLYPNGSILTIEGQLYYNNNPKDGHLLVSDSDGLISFATPSVYGAGLTLTGLTVSVTSGIIYIFNKTTGIPTYYTTLELARDGSVSGDTIYVNAGNYTVTTTATNGLSKEGVNWYFETGAIVTKATSGIMFGNGTLPQYILGYGSFYGTTLCSSIFQSLPNNSIIEGIIASSTSGNTINGTGTHCEISFNGIYSTSGYTLLYIGGYSNVTANKVTNTSTLEAIFAPGPYSVFNINELSTTIARSVYHAYTSSNVTLNIKYCANTIYCAGAVTLNVGYLSIFSQAVSAACSLLNGKFGTINCAGEISGSFWCSNLVVNSGYSNCTGVTMTGNGSVLTVSAGYCEVNYDIFANYNVGAQITITGGVAVLKGKWIDANTYTSCNISAGKLIIDDKMILDLCARAEFFKVSGTAIVDLGRSRIYLNSSLDNLGQQYSINSAFRWSGGTIISNGATIITSSTNNPPILAEVPGLNFKVLSGGFNTNYVNSTYGVLDAKKKKYKFNVGSVNTTRIALNDLSGVDETFQETNTTLYNTTALLAQRMVALINASATLDITASQDIPGTDTYFYCESDVTGVNINHNNGSAANIAPWQVIVGNSYAITNTTGGYIIEDLDILN